MTLVVARCDDVGGCALRRRRGGWALFVTVAVVFHGDSGVGQAAGHRGDEGNRVVGHHGDDNNGCQGDVGMSRRRRGRLGTTMMKATWCSGEGGASQVAGNYGDDVAGQAAGHDGARHRATAVATTTVMTTAAARHGEDDDGR
ncbi:hypothetical protein GUJ93_ZPchr0425g17 [Zizania palustris]|uniref:Uncharacterized protein n=1 Tax=Zizania palustris TaxID=103762 RepID=A0A8J5R5X1_ZIZPA|nr:hypothetical protein GUJ93_ZPchr0425g17 [Zizania palustris]